MLLAVLVLGALLLRLVAAGDPLSNDEGYTWLVSSSHGLGTFLDRLAAYENTPPLYYLLAWPLPDGEAWLRLPSVLAGVACVAALYWAVLPLSGRRAALLSSMALAVAPYAVSYSDFARGFMLSDLGLVVALGGAVRRRWWIYAVGAAVALWAEYDSALFLVALTAALAWNGLAPRREAIARGLLPLLALAPLVPLVVHGAQAVGKTKVAPVYPAPSADTLRDLVVRLTFGEHGTAHGAGIRWLQFAAVAAVLLLAARALARPTRRLLAGIALGTVGLHALSHFAGLDVFEPRYMTALVPLGAAAVGIAVSRVPARAAAPLAAAALAAAGIAVAVVRAQRTTEPEVSAVGLVVAPAAHGRIVLTNSAAVAYYLRDLKPHLDRPFGLGPGLESGCTAGCRASFLVVDDVRVANSPRPGPGSLQIFGPVYVRATPQGAAGGSR
jgi:4-amino-4-deoxy-L-arabinose transferase-like glycosyltransferase